MAPHDSDLAHLYGVTTFNLNKAVKRNPDHFPSDFMFQLDPKEHERLIFQSGISNIGRGGRRFAPFAFTQEGIAMLSSVLRSPRATQVNIAIMRAFVKLRRALAENRELFQRIERLEGKIELHDTDIRLLYQDLHDLKKNPPPPPEKSISVKGFK